MATFAQNLETARNAYAAELAAGNVKPSYSIDGQSVSWNEYRSNLMEMIEKLDAKLASADPVETVSYGL